MSLRNTDEVYGNVAIFFHWLIALAILMMFVLGIIFIEVSGNPPWRETIIDVHKSLGITILFLMVLRLIWRLANPVPILPLNLPLWEKFSAHAMIYFLYLAIFVMIFSGWISSSAGSYPVSFWGLFSVKLPLANNKWLSHLTEDIHLWFAWIIGILVGLHFLAAMKHHFINKNEVLRRMLPH